MRAEKAKNTQLAYASDLRHFGSWCRAHENESLPAAPETVASYLTALANGTADHFATRLAPKIEAENHRFATGTRKLGPRKFATIRRRAAALAFAHRSAGYDSPLSHPGVKATLEGIARVLGRAPAKKTALTADLLGKAVRKIPVHRRSPARAAEAANSANTRSDIDVRSEPDLAGLRNRVGRKDVWRWERAE
jgi:hypothetical protein